MRNSNVKIIISTKCELLVSPRENLKDPGFVYLEFLVSDYIDTLSTLVISDSPELFRYYFNQDGLYMYYRLKVPTKNKLENVTTTNRLYFDKTTQKLMIGNDEVETSEQLENVVNDDSPYTSYGVTEMIEEPVFSICRISTCLANLQRKFIFEGHPNLIGTDCKNDSDKNIRDFLFSSVFILRILIKQQRYEEALRILESINYCNGICESTYTSNKNSCGCNK